MSAKKAVVLTFDRLPITLLGCFGNVELMTPNFDRLAARSAVFDAHYAARLPGQCEAADWWTSRHHDRRRSGAERGGDLETVLRSENVRLHLLAEGPHDGPDAAVPAKHDFVRVDGIDGLEAEPEETPFAQLSAEAVRCLDRMSDRPVPELLWLSSRGVPVPWIPPAEYSEFYLEEDDSDEHPGFQCDHPNDRDDAGRDKDLDQRAMLAPGSVSDEAWRDDSDAGFEQYLLSGGQPGDGAPLTLEDWQLSSAVCAGYVALLDHWLGMLLDALEPHLDTGTWLLLVTSGRGISLGERVGLGETCLGIGDEMMRVPLFVCGGEVGPLRTDQLSQSLDVAPTVADWFGAGPEHRRAYDGISLLSLSRGDNVSVQDRTLFYGSARARAVRTSDFCVVADADALRRALAHSGDDRSCAESLPQSSSRLFIKPDDVWCVNDVTVEFPDVRLTLLRSLIEFERGEC